MLLQKMIIRSRRCIYLIIMIIIIIIIIIIIMIIMETWYRTLVHLVADPRGDVHKIQNVVIGKKSFVVELIYTLIQEQ